MTTTAYTASLRVPVYRVRIVDDEYHGLTQADVLGEGVELVTFGRGRLVSDISREARLHGDWPEPGEIDEDPNAFWIDYYEHGLCRYSLAGEGPSCQWDTVQRAGFIRLDVNVLGQMRPGGNESLARVILDQYTAWANGEVYGIEVRDERGEIVDFVGGYVGLDGLVEYAEEVAGRYERAVVIDVDGQEV